MTPARDAATLESRRTHRVALALFYALLLLASLEVVLGDSARDTLGLGDVLRGLRAMLGLGEPLGELAQPRIELRVWRTLTAAGVGACLAVAGALLQGLFRNPLASPSLIGVTAGASFGQALAVLALGGYTHALVGAGLTDAGPWLTTAAAFVGALVVGAGVVLVGRRLSLHRGVATLLLLGVAVNTCIAGALAAVQDLLATRSDFDTLKALLTWSTGTLDDRRPYQCVLVGIGVVVAAALTPRVSRELDLLSAGEDDARSLGVDTDRVHRLALVAAAFATAGAVAAAGQIGFVGLVVPHLLRLAVSTSHRALLPLSILGGAVFVLLTDVTQRIALGDRPLHPGPVMSLIGGPLFLWLLVRHLRRQPAW